MMTEMLKPESVFRFGKYKGKKLQEIIATDPSYLYWLKKTGFSEFGMEITKFLFAWEEEFPKEAERIDRSIAKKKATEISARAETKASPAPELSWETAVSFSKETPMPPPAKAAVAANPLFGSW